MTGPVVDCRILGAPARRVDLLTLFLVLVRGDAGGEGADGRGGRHRLRADEDARALRIQRHTHRESPLRFYLEAGSRFTAPLCLNRDVAGPVDGGLLVCSGL